MIPNLVFLHTKFDELNHQCFNEVLPHPEIRLNTRWHMLGRMYVRKRKQQNGQPSGKQMWIEISTRRDLAEAKVVDILLHEMIHYYIEFKEIKDNKMHGDFFCKMMNDLNDRFGYHVSVLYHEEDDVLVHTVMHYRFICVVRKSDSCYVMVVAKNKVNQFVRALSTDEYKGAVEWYISDRAIFRIYPIAVRIRLNAISEDKLQFYLTGAHRLKIEEVISWSVAKAKFPLGKKGVTEDDLCQKAGFAKIPPTDLNNSLLKSKKILKNGNYDVIQLLAKRFLKLANNKNVPALRT